MVGIVITADQRDSRRVGDLVDSVLQLGVVVADLVRPFERTAGDEVQAVVASPESAVTLGLHLASSGAWSVGIGIGDIEMPLPRSTRAGRGAAFASARDAVERAKRGDGAIAVTGGSAPWTEDAEAVLRVVSDIIGRRSAEGREVVAELAGGATQADVAVRLGVSKQAVSQRAARAWWRHEVRLRRAAVNLIAQAARAT